MMPIAVRRLAAAIALVTAASLVSSCDTFPANHAIGVTSGPNGNVVVRYVACREERVKELQLYRNSDDDPFVGESSDELPWDVISPSGEAIGSFTVGQTPAGFMEKVPLSRKPSPTEPLGVRLVTTKAQPTTRFRVTDLRPGRILNGGESMDPTTFQREAEDSCH
jgi:hypothetical protein